LELFFPLYIIANTFNQIVLNKILKITSKMYEESKTEERTESRDVMVYQFVAMQDDNLDYIDMVSLLNQFKQYVHDDEHDFQWVNSKWLGRSLKRLNLIIDKRRMAMGMQITLDVKKAIKQVEMFK